ncbi:hypothetical protein V8E53_009084 [Lactarius tabidus]
MHASLFATLVLVAASAVAPVLSTPITVRVLSNEGSLVARDDYVCPDGSNGACVGIPTSSGNGEP